MFARYNLTASYVQYRTTKLNCILGKKSCMMNLLSCAVNKTIKILLSLTLYWHIQPIKMSHFRLIPWLKVPLWHIVFTKLL